MKRTLFLLAFAILIPAPSAIAQTDGEWQIKNENVRATGNATNGTCEPTEFPLQIDINFGPGNKVETAQGEQRTQGRFDTKTGRIKTSSGSESYVLKPDGKSHLSGTNRSHGCRWAVDFNLNKPGLVFVMAEPAAEAVASPSPAEEAPAGAAGASDQQQEGGNPLLIWIPGALLIIGGAVFVFRRLQTSTDTAAGTKVVKEPDPQPAEPPWRCNACDHEATRKEFFQREVFTDDDDDYDDEDYEPVYEPADSPMCPNCGETEAVGEGTESILDEISPPRVIA